MRITVERNLKGLSDKQREEVAKEALSTFKDLIYDQLKFFIWKSHSEDNISYQIDFDKYKEMYYWEGGREVYKCIKFEYEKD